MATTEVTRGSTIMFVAAFTDSQGLATNPSAATLTVTYRRAGISTTDTIPMSQSGNDWSASWESSLADGGRADWHIRSAGSGKAASEGTLMLKTNPANPAS